MTFVVAFSLDFVFRKAKILNPIKSKAEKKITDFLDPVWSDLREKLSRTPAEDQEAARPQRRETVQSL